MQKLDHTPTIYSTCEHAKQINSKKITHPNPDYNGPPLITMIKLLCSNI